MLGLRARSRQRHQLGRLVDELLLLQSRDEPRPRRDPRVSRERQGFLPITATTTARTSLQRNSWWLTDQLES